MKISVSNMMVGVIALALVCAGCAQVLSPMLLPTSYEHYLPTSYEDYVRQTREGLKMAGIHYMSPEQEELMLKEGWKSYQEMMPLIRAFLSGNLTEGEFSEQIELIARKNYQNSIEALEKSNNPENWVESGRARLLAKDLRGAETAFRQALRLDDKYLPAYKHLGLVLVELKRYQETKDIYEQALLRISDEDSELWTAYGYCLVNLDNDNKALEAFQRSINLNNNSVAVISARLGASALLRRRGDIVGAQREYEEALKADPEIVKILREQKNLSTTTVQPKEETYGWVDPTSGMLIVIDPRLGMLMDPERIEIDPSRGMWRGSDGIWRDSRGIGHTGAWIDNYGEEHPGD